MIWKHGPNNFIKERGRFRAKLSVSDTLAWTNIYIDWHRIRHEEHVLTSERRLKSWADTVFMRAVGEIQGEAAMIMAEL